MQHGRVVEADRLAAELGCEVVPHLRFAGMVEARDAAPGLWPLSGTPDEVRNEAFRVRALARRGALLDWLTVLGKQG